MTEQPTDATTDEPIFDPYLGRIKTSNKNMVDAEIASLAARLIEIADNNADFPIGNDARLDLRIAASHLAMQAAAPTPNGEGVVKRLTIKDPYYLTHMSHCGPAHDAGCVYGDDEICPALATPINSEGLDAAIARSKKHTKNVLLEDATCNRTCILIADFETMVAALEAVRAGDGRS